MEHIIKAVQSIAASGTVYYTAKTWLQSTVVTDSGHEIEVLSPKSATDTRNLSDDAITVAILPKLKGSSQEDLDELGLPKVAWIDTTNGQLFFQDPR